MAMRAAIGTKHKGSDRERLCAALAVRGKGSILRGFRRELDTDGSLCVGFLDFCKAAKRLGVMVDASRLFGEDSPDSLTLDDLAPEVGKLVWRFRRWMVKTFGGPGEMFLAFEAQEDSHGKLSRETFLAGCQSHGGFEASEEELSEIFCLLDVDDTGCLAMEDAMFLDLDEKRRQGAILKATNRGKLEQQNLLAVVYREDTTKNLSRTHRLAPREWNAASIERLPALVHEKHKDWQRCRQRRASKAMSTFMSHLSTSYGNVVRAWRRGLDPDAHFTISRVELGRYCVRTNVHVDVSTLWKALDQDSDGSVSMEELGPRPAMALARVREWLRERFDSCADAWDALRMAAGPSEKWKSDKKMFGSAFMQALEQLGCPIAADPSMGSLLCPSLDFYACGIISREDLEWLDRWPAAEWLSASPDAEAWAELRRLMLNHGRPLRVWRSLLDTDNSNLVTWVEFQEACRAVGFRGNIAGAWCHLDEDNSGNISLQEFDPHTAEMLASFKAWVQDHFGTVEFAFRSLDTDGSGSVSFSELKRGCLRLKWEGDTRELFECLDDDSTRRTLSYKELEFLDSWEPNPWVWEEAERISPAPKAARPRCMSGTIMGKSATSLPKLATQDCQGSEPSETNPSPSHAASSPALTIREEASPKSGRLPKQQQQQRTLKAASPYATPLVNPAAKVARESSEVQRLQKLTMLAFADPAAFAERAFERPLPKAKRQLLQGASGRLLAPVLGRTDPAALRAAAKLRRNWAPGEQQVVFASTLAEFTATISLPVGGGKLKARPHSRAEGEAPPAGFVSAPMLTHGTSSPICYGKGGRGQQHLSPRAERTPFEVISGRTVALAVAPD